MTILERVEKDIPIAMRVRETLRLETLRSIKTALDLQRHAGVVLTADKETAVLKTLAKQRVDSAEIYKTAGRVELAQKEEIECGIIRQYLPEEASADETSRMVDVVLTEMLAQGPVTVKRMGEAIKQVKDRLGKPGDGKLISDLVRARLS